VTVRRDVSRSDGRLTVVELDDLLQTIRVTDTQQSRPAGQLYFSLDGSVCERIRSASGVEPRRALNDQFELTVTPALSDLLGSMAYGNHGEAVDHHYYARLVDARQLLVKYRHRSASVEVGRVTGAQLDALIETAAQRLAEAHGERHMIDEQAAMVPMDRARA